MLLLRRPWMRRSTVADSWRIVLVLWVLVAAWLRCKEFENSTLLLQHRKVTKAIEFDIIQSQHVVSELPFAWGVFGFLMRVMLSLLSNLCPGAFQRYLTLLTSAEIFTACVFCSLHFHVLLNRSFSDSARKP